MCGSFGLAMKFSSALFSPFLGILLGTVITIGFLLWYFKIYKREKLLPPYTPTGFWKNLKQDGYQRVIHLYQESLWITKHTSQDITTGCVFRLQIPWFGGIMICCDYKLARLLLQGNEEKSIQESEKTSLSQNLNLYENINTLLT